MILLISLCELWHLAWLTCQSVNIQAFSWHHRIFWSSPLTCELQHTRCKSLTASLALNHTERDVNPSLFELAVSHWESRLQSSPINAVNRDRTCLTPAFHPLSFFYFTQRLEKLLASAPAVPVFFKKHWLVTPTIPIRASLWRTLGWCYCQAQALTLAPSLTYSVGPSL